MLALARTILIAAKHGCWRSPSFICPTRLIFAATLSLTDDLIKAQRGSAMYPGSHSQIQSLHSNPGHVTLGTICFITKLSSQDSFRSLALGATSSGPALTAGSHGQELTPNLIFARLVNMTSSCQAW